ncbi:hypothetical protein B1R94_24195 [Mycolicibacterium litorale]|nr:hypothetical protein B1R94_24195 [Mycolicibacterium litorale]
MKGTVTAVTGNTIAVRAKTGPPTVEITPSTKIFQVNPAQLTDVTAGSCADIRLAAAAAGGAAQPAKQITVSAATNGKCPESSSERVLRGTIAAVTGQSVSLVNSSAGATAVDQNTKYFKQVATTALAITPGACLSSVGPVGPNGVQQATKATVGPPAGPKGCPGS